MCTDILYSMGCTLHQSHGHSHGGGGSSHAHGHSHGGNNINVTTAFIHVVGDFVQSAGVFVAALIIYFKPEYEIADPICTFIFSIIVLVTTFNVMKQTFMVLMEGEQLEEDRLYYLPSNMFYFTHL